MSYSIYTKQDYPQIENVHSSFFGSVKECLDKKLKGINAASNKSYSAIVKGFNNLLDGNRNDDVSDYLIEVKENDDWSLKLQLEARSDQCSNNNFRIKLLFGISVKKDSCNILMFKNVYNYWTQYKPALIYRRKPWGNNITSTITRIQCGSKQNNFNSSDWLFAEDVDWLFNSIMDTSNQKYNSDEVANWFCTLIGMI